MTERRTNRLIGDQGGSRAAFVTANGDQAPTDIDGYCAWLNAQEHRRGRWIVVDDKKIGKRRVDFVQASASDDWLREKGIVPSIGRAA